MQKKRSSLYWECRETHSLWSELILVSPAAKQGWITTTTTTTSSTATQLTTTTTTTTKDIILVVTPITKMFFRKSGSVAICFTSYLSNGRRATIELGFNSYTLQIFQAHIPRFFLEIFHKVDSQSSHCCARLLKNPFGSTSIINWALRSRCIMRTEPDQTEH